MVDLELLLAQSVHVVPFALLVLLLPYEVFKLRLIERQLTRQSSLFTSAKIVSLCLFAFLVFILLIKQHFFFQQFIAVLLCGIAINERSLIAFAGYAISCSLIYENAAKFVHSTGVLFSFWLLSFICNFATFLTNASVS